MGEEYSPAAPAAPFSFSAKAWTLGFLSLLNSLVIFAEVGYCCYYTPELAANNGINLLTLFTTIFVVLNYLEFVSFSVVMKYMRVANRFNNNNIVHACFMEGVYAMFLKLSQIMLFCVWYLICSLPELKEEIDAGTIVPFYKYYTLTDYSTFFGLVAVMVIQIWLPACFLITVQNEKEGNSAAVLQGAAPRDQSNSGYSPLVNSV